MKDAKNSKVIQLENRVDTLKKDVEEWKARAAEQKDRVDDLYWQAHGRFA